VPEKTFAVNFETSGFRKASKQMDAIGDEADESGSQLASAGAAGKKALAGIATAVTGAVAGMGALISKTTEYAKQVDQAASQSGMAVEDIQEIAYVAKQVSGTSFDTVRDGLKELAIRSQEAAMGSGEAKEAFDRLGISQQFLKQSDTSEVFRRVRSELSQATPQMRTFASEAIFGGEAGEKLTEVLGLTEAQMKSLRGEAEQSGQVLSQSQVSALERTRESWTRLTQSVSGFARQIAAGLAPVLNSKVIPGLRSMAKSLTETIRALMNLSDTTKGVIAIITGLTAALVVGQWAQAAISIAKITSALSKLRAVAATTWATMTGPVAAAIAAVAGLAAVAYLVYDNWGSLGDFFSDLYASIKDATNAFVGIIKSAFKLMWLQIKRLFYSGLNGIIDAINAAAQAVGMDKMFDNVDGGPAQEEIEKVKVAGNEAAAQLGDAFADIGGQLAGGMSDAWDEIVAESKKGLDALGGMFSFDVGATASSEGAAEGTANGGAGGSDGSGSDPVAQKASKAQVQGTESLGYMERLLKKQKQVRNAALISSRQIGATVQGAIGGISRQMGNFVTSLWSAEEGFQSIGDAAKSFGKAFMGILKSVIKQLVTAIAKMAIMKGIMSVFSIGTGGFAGGLMGVGGGGGVIPFADGGIVTGPTNALIGEAGPEAVIPLNKLDQFMGGGQHVTVSVKDQVIRGQDIHTSYHVSQRNQRRRGHASR